MASAHPITDHDEIRDWAEERGARPACVKGTGGKNDTGMIRLDFPGYSGSESLQPISWDDWFRQFDENNLALIVQDTTSRGQQSNFNKLVKRSTAAARGSGRSARTRKTARSARSTSRHRSSTSSRSTSSRSTSGRSRKAASASRASSGRKASPRSSRKTARARGRKATSRSKSRQR